MTGKNKENRAFRIGFAIGGLIVMVLIFGVSHIAYLSSFKCSVISDNWENVTLDLIKNNCKYTYEGYDSYSGIHIANPDKLYCNTRECKGGYCKDIKIYLGEVKNNI